MWIIWEAEHEIFLVFVSGNGYLGIFHALNTPFEYMKRKLIPYITKDQSRVAFINKKYPNIISILRKPNPHFLFLMLLATPQIILLFGHI